ncbi:MAG: ORC1-type DNA replication protein [Candidatus Hermodarchaeota archaeon]
MDIFENLLRKQTVFIDQTKLEINYVPKELPHRNKEISLLSQLFLILLTNPNEISRKILITGKTGIGKTVTVKRFGKILTEASNRRNISIKYIHINCRKEKSSYKVLIRILSSIIKNFPKRGYAPGDLLDILKDTLDLKNLHLLVVLDELSYLINNDNDLIYSLTRLYDDLFNSPQRISIIGIAREISCLNNLDNSTLSTLQKNIIKFEEYSYEETFDILKYRAEISFKENVITNEILEMISDIVASNGDIRYGLNLLWKAGKIAESNNLNFIDAECVRLANQDQVLFSTLDFLNELTNQKLLFLLSIIKTLQLNNNEKITFLDILKTYNVFCENVKLNPRSYSQLYNYLKELKKEKFITARMQSKNIKGRKALIEITDIPLKKFEDEIKTILNSKGIKI